jgi:(1->4)-alpha-D-glucan 1-alpha-D-glucosylmutase
MVKAVREAKVNSSWLEPNAAWEEAVRAFVAVLLDPDGLNRFSKSFAPLAARIAQLGAVNSSCADRPSSSLVLECRTFTRGLNCGISASSIRTIAVPWISHSAGRCLETITDASPRELLEHWRDGRIKMFIIQRLLALRGEEPALLRTLPTLAFTRRRPFAEHVIFV